MTFASKRRTVWAAESACHYCRHWVPDSQQTVDHVWPRTLGGPDANWNLVPACQPCNNAKGNKANACDCGFCRSARSRARAALAAQPTTTEAS